MILTPSLCVTLFVRNSPQWARATLFTSFLDQTQRRITVGRTPLGKRSARRSDIYLTTHNNNNRQTTMPPLGFESTISAAERPQTDALERAATGTNVRDFCSQQIAHSFSIHFRTFYQNYPGLALGALVALCLQMAPLPRSC